MASWFNIVEPCIYLVQYCGAMYHIYLDGIMHPYISSAVSLYVICNVCVYSCSRVIAFVRVRLSVYSLDAFERVWGLGCRV